MKIALLGIRNDPRLSDAFPLHATVRAGPSFRGFALSASGFAA